MTSKRFCRFFLYPHLRAEPIYNECTMLGFGALSLFQITLMEVEKVDQKQQESVYTTNILMYFFAL